MKKTGVAVIVALLIGVLHVDTASAQATQEDVKCGPASWRNPDCKICKMGGKSYVVSRFVEGAISIVLATFKDPAASKPVADAIGKAVGAAPVAAKRWQEGGEANPEAKDTYCWKPVKAELIKPLKDKGYGLGEISFDKCRVYPDVCYHVTMECAKERDGKVWTCMPSLQEFKARGGKCLEADSPRKGTCDCQPSQYWKCGLGAVKGPPRKGR